MEETLIKLSSAYIALLTIPADNKFRYSNQAIYSMLRDYIAEQTGCTQQEVQAQHEDLANDALEDE